MKQETNNIIEFKINGNYNTINKNKKFQSGDFISHQLSESRPTCFLIDGGGTKGIYALGVFKYLFEDNPYVNLNDIELFGGTSVGSYLATALSFGYKKDDIMELSKQVDLNNLTDGKYLFILTIFRFLTHGYMYNYNGRKNIIKQILEFKLNTIKEHLNIPFNQKFMYDDLTFKHLRILVSTYPKIYKHLLINTVDLSRGMQIFMTTMEEKWDDIKIIDALLASSSIPYVFELVKIYYDPINDKYCYQKSPNYTLNTLADGGTSTNNPYEYFLINNNLSDYKIWMLEFTKQPKYVNINNGTILLTELVEFWIYGKNHIALEILDEKYDINIINLHLTAGTLDIYTQEQIHNIINKIYDECKKGNFFGFHKK